MGLLVPPQRCSFSLQRILRPSNDSTSLKLHASTTLLLKELQHVMHRMAPEAVAQLTVAKALACRACRGSESCPAISHDSFGMECASRRRALAKHDRGPCAPQSLQARALVV